MKTWNENILADMLDGDVPETEDRSPASEQCAFRLKREDGACIRPVSKEKIEAEVIELLREYAGSLSRYAGTVARNKAIVQDGVQETFLRYFAARTDGQEIGNPRAWLFRVLRNYILDCNRKSGSMSEIDLGAAAQIADPRQDLERKYQKNEAFQRVLCALSHRERECFLLRLEGFGYEDIAQILKIRVGTVGALITRGFKKIRHFDLLSRSVR